jgi:hypothetical protein
LESRIRVNLTCYQTSNAITDFTIQHNQGQKISPYYPDIFSSSPEIKSSEKTALYKTARLDKCLQTAGALTAEQLIMRLPEDGANMRGKA